jgi:hypothetical protein
MKTKRAEKKRVIMLNKRTIANLNHREMVKVKGREVFQQDDELVVGSETDICGCPTPIDTDTFRLSIIKVFCNQNL